MHRHQPSLAALIKACAEVPELELAVLVGSQTSEAVGPDRDWDIAIRWHAHVQAATQLALSAALTQRIAQVLAIHPDKVDLIHLPAARLAMREVVANQGVPLKGEQTLAWFHFLSQTWAEVEDFYWRKNHAA